jgi:hypothetical protein
VEKELEMSVEGSRTLVLIGAILQIILSIVFIILGAIMLWSFIGQIPYGVMYGSMPHVSVLFMPMLPLGIVGQILAVFWFRWRGSPSEYKTHLIATGIVCMILIGFVGGLLTLIGGARAPGEHGEYGGV